MFTTFTALALAGGALRLVLQWQLKKRWGISLGIPQALAGALVVLAGLPEFIKPFPYPVDLSRFSAAPRARLSHLSFESARAFPAQC